MVHLMAETDSLWTILNTCTLFTTTHTHIVIPHTAEPNHSLTSI